MLIILDAVAGIISLGGEAPTFTMPRAARQPTTQELICDHTKNQFALALLPAQLQARRQPIRQLRRQDALLGLLDVIRYAIECNACEGPAIVFIDRESRSP